MSFVGECVYDNGVFDGVLFSCDELKMHYRYENATETNFASICDRPAKILFHDSDEYTADIVSSDAFVTFTIILINQNVHAICIVPIELCRPVFERIDAEILSKN